MGSLQELEEFEFYIQSTGTVAVIFGQLMFGKISSRLYQIKHILTDFGISYLQP